MNERKTSALTLLVIVTAIAACAPAGGGPPEIRIDHTACAYCSMLISEPAYAAAYRVDGADKAFDDIGCLIAALRQEPDGDAAELWFRDVHDGSWITPAAAPTFIRSPSLRTPMAGGTVATVHEDEVERFEQDHEAMLYPSFEALLAAHSDAKASEEMHSAATATEEVHAAATAAAEGYQ
jgi:copper chaperone NosL